jgi:hypothetical protein
VKLISSLTGKGITVSMLASSALAVTTSCTAVAVGKEGVAVAVAGRGEASAVAVGGVAVVPGMVVASAGRLVVGTTVSISGTQLASERKKKEMSIICLMN